MSRGFNHKKRPWSKLQKQVKNLFVKELNLKIHCTVYVKITKEFTFESPRHWITMDKEIIWDFPGPFMEWKCEDLEKSIKHLDGPYYKGENGSIISRILREYIDTNKSELLKKEFTKDKWGLTNILLAADRRIGKRKLNILQERLKEDDSALVVIKKRLSLQ